MVDLGTAAGFQAATMSSASSAVSGVSSALNLLTGLNLSNWNIQEAAFGHPPSNLVVFNVFKAKVDYSAGVDQVQDNIARRLAVFEFPYVDGQTTDDLGRKGESYDFNIIIYGPNYYAAYLSLIKEFNNPLPGTLVHPVRGRMIVKFKNAQVIHKSAERQAVTLRATFIEHNFEASFVAPSATTKSALSKAVSFIGAISSVITSIQSNTAAIGVLGQVANSVISGITGSVTSFNSVFTNALVAINTSFNAGSSADLPALLPVTPGTGTAFTVAESPNDPTSALTPAQIQAIQSPVLTPSQANDMVAAVWTQANNLIEMMESANRGQGALIFYSQILVIRQSVVALAQSLASALQSSNANILTYMTPRLMSVREVCFANNVPVDNFQQVLLLNPSILSANYIPQGITLQVPNS